MHRTETKIEKGVIASVMHQHQNPSETMMKPSKITVFWNVTSCILVGGY
jgi:hypothetical protein